MKNGKLLDHWDEWLDAWSAAGDMHSELAREAEAQGRSLSSGETWVRAAPCYHFAKFVWMLDVDKYRATANKAISSLYAAHRHLDPTAERIEMSLDDKHLSANLRRPAGNNRPALVVLLPGLDSAKEEFFNWENVFLKRGLATVSFDGPGQGESGFNSHTRADYEVAVATLLDRLIPWQQADRLAAEAPNATLVMYPDGNHVCNNLPFKYRPLVGDWMVEQLESV